MNEARLKIIPKTPPSAMGFNLSGMSVNPEMDGAMALLHFSTPDASVEIRCTHVWALAAAEQIIKRIAEFKQHCEQEDVAPIETKP